MATIKIRQSGFTLARSPVESSAAGKSFDSQRGNTSGWSPKSMMRNETFLQSIAFRKIDMSCAYAVTLTFAVAPPSPEIAKKCLHTMLIWLKRQGFGLYHWVMEWATRSRYEGASAVPHFHLSIFNTDGLYATVSQELFEIAIKEHWCKIANQYGAKVYGQHVAPIQDAQGWAKYVAKHSSRSAYNAQRSDILPAGWEKPGRMWGNARGFPTLEESIKITDEFFFKIRRAVLKLQRARCQTKLTTLNCQKKRQIVKRSLVFYRRALKHPRERSERLPVTQWIDYHILAKNLSFLVDEKLKQDYL